MTTIMNLVAIVRFFKAIYRDIFEYLLAVGSKDEEFFGPISTYFGIVETNGQRILHLHCLIWFCNAFHITQLYE